MSSRAGAPAAFFAIALTCGVSAMWRQGALAPATPAKSRGAGRSYELRPLLDKVSVAAPGAPANDAVAPRPASAAAPARSHSSSETGLDEAALMRLLESAQGSDAAIALAREGNRRFPDSPDAPERASILIHALAEQGLSSEARGEAEDMVNRYPDSAWVRGIEQFTGAHRHRNVQVGPNGELHYLDPELPTRR